MSEAVYTETPFQVNNLEVSLQYVQLLRHYILSIACVGCYNFPRRKIDHVHD